MGGLYRSHGLVYYGAATRGRRDLPFSLNPHSLCHEGTLTMRHIILLLVALLTILAAAGCVQTTEEALTAHIERLENQIAIRERHGASVGDLPAKLKRARTTLQSMRD